jgi:hypothetical protein
MLGPELGLLQAVVKPFIPVGLALLHLLGEKV